MSPAQLQSVNDLIRKHSWNLQAVEIGKFEFIDRNWFVKIFADGEMLDFQIDENGFVSEFLE